jgi:hypothetical protein
MDEIDELVDNICNLGYRLSDELDRLISDEREVSLDSVLGYQIDKINAMLNIITDRTVKFKMLFLGGGRDKS